MEVLPAIDLRDGKVVRLRQGDYAEQTTYSSDPAGVAKTLAAAGAKWIHVVDLDAARTGAPANAPALRAICEAVGLKVQFGGGMRNDAAIESALSVGVARVVVGSAALKDWAWFHRLVGRTEMAGRIALGLDARAGRLAVQGWTRQTQVTAVEVARRVRGWLLGAIVYTDIARDGMLAGVNIPATAELIAATDVPVIASGGVSCLQDVLECKRIGCAGVIVGRAYYEGKIDLARACALAGEDPGGGSEEKKF
jgi:phosphoribosylformimino-5-aminoimidazole carboxamide ribotide isomerase